MIKKAGFLSRFKFWKNPTLLRQYIVEMAEGVIPDKIYLLNTHISDDVMFVEQGLDIIFQELRQRAEVAEQQFYVEHELREILKQHRATIQRLGGAACHHIGKPVNTLKLRLSLLKQIANSEDELAQIEECEKDLNSILNALDKSRTVNESGTLAHIRDEVRISAK